MEYTTNAPKGAELLDEIRPGWADEIDVRRLDMSLGGWCILGQLHGKGAELGYAAGLEALTGHGPMNLESHQFALDHGFNASMDHGDPDMAPWLDRMRKLTEEWRELVRERKHAA